MKRKTNKTKEEAWSQTAHAPDGEQPGPEASGTSGQSVPKSKFRKKSQQEQAAAAKLRMDSQGEKLEQAREKLAKQKPPKKPGPVKRIGRVAVVPFTASCMARFLKWNRKMSAQKAHTVLSLWEKPRCGTAPALCAVKSGNIRQKWYARPRPAIPNTRRTTIFTPSHRSTRS